MPRRRAITELYRTKYPTTMPTGFTGGLAAGLLGTVPYMALPQQRISALEEALLQVATGERARQVEEQIAGQKMRGDIAETHLLFKPATGQEPYNPLLSQMMGYPVREATLEEVHQYVSTGKTPAQMLALHKSVLPAWIQQQLGYTRMMGSEFVELLKSLGLYKQFTESEQKMADQIRNYELFVPLADLNYLLQARDTLEQLARARGLLGKVITQRFGLPIEQPEKKQEKQPAKTIIPGR